MDVFVDSETAPLRSVIVGYPDNFMQVDPEIINETQRRFYAGPDAPTRAAVTEQLNGFMGELVSRGIEVFQPHPLPYLPDQMMTRDIGVVIGDTFVVTTMAARSRRHEWRGYAHLFERFPEHVKVLFGPEDLVIEGGDVIVDRGKVFVGIGQRTTLAGAAWLMQLVPEYEIVPITLARAPPRRGCAAPGLLVPAGRRRPRADLSGRNARDPGSGSRHLRTDRGDPGGAADDWGPMCSRSTHGP